MSIENPTLAHFSHFSHFYLVLGPLHLSRTLYKSTLFIQNKANFRKSRMNVNLYNTTNYENKSDWTLGENEPKTNPIKPNLKRAQMNVNSLITKDYRKNDAFAVQKNKPNSNPISSKAKMNVSSVLTRKYENVPLRRRRENKPNQTQFQTFCWGCRTEKIMFCNRLNGKCQIIILLLQGQRTG